MEANKLKKLVESTCKLNVLYVEDNEDVMSSTLDILNTFFTNIDTAMNGEEGLEKFKEKADFYDLIISDINMPKMNGLDMISEIKKINREILVVITTAHNDYSYLIKSIEMKVDRYLMKPLNINQIIDILGDISKIINDKKMLAQLLEKEHQEALKAKEEEIIQKFTNVYITPTAIFQNGRLIHCSDSFADLFDDRDKNSLFNISIDDYTIFIKLNGYMSSFEDYDSENHENNKVSISKKVGKRIYRVYKKSIDFNDSNADIYIFVNITNEEYLKMKIESYATSLEKMVIKNQKSKIDKDITTDILIEKKNDLISAKDFVKKINQEYIKEIEELNDLDSDIAYAMESFEKDDSSKLIEISYLLKKYSNVIHLFREFEDLYIAIHILSELFISIDFSKIDTNKHSAFFTYLKNIRDGLSQWRKSIFIEQSCDNIHFLDKSLISTSLQLEVLISESEENIEIDESDLDFF